jgi:carboxymethylenebutenolidase
MCYDLDARPPLPPIRGSALDAGELTLTSADGAAVAAYAARASVPGGAGIVILPDVRGLHPFYEELALRFAEAGIDAVAIDYFARSAGSAPRGRDFDFMSHVAQARLETLTMDAAAGVAHLRTAAGGAAARIFTIGFCFGGRLSSLQAAAGHGLSGVISFYGSPVGTGRAGMPGPVEVVERFECPVLAVYGGADQGIPPDAIAAYDRALEAAGVGHRSIVYPDAPHSFFDRLSTEFAAACDDAWRQVLDFVADPQAASDRG